MKKSSDKATQDAATKMLGGKGYTAKKNESGQWTIHKFSGEKVEHDNPADYYNTVVKMGKKRAFVDATLTVTAASDIFSQDLEDMPEVFKGAEKFRQREADHIEDGQLEPESEKKPTTENKPTPRQTPPPSDPPPANNSNGAPGVFDNWTPEQCREVCEKSPELKAVVMRFWKEKIQTYATLVNIFNACGGDQAAIIREIQG